MKYKIVDVNRRDLNFIIEMNQKYIQMVSHLTSNQMSWFFDNSAYFKVVKCDNKIIAFIIALYPNLNYQSNNYVWFNKKYNSHIYIDRIIVEKKYQNRGVGSAIYNDLILFSKNITRRITCEVNVKPRNHRSILFHKKFKFFEVGREKLKKLDNEVSYLVLNHEKDTNE